MVAVVAAGSDVVALWLVVAAGTDGGGGTGVVRPACCLPLRPRLYGIIWEMKKKEVNNGATVNSNNNKP